MVLNVYLKDIYTVNMEEYDQISTKKALVLTHTAEFIFIFALILWKICSIVWNGL